MYRFKCIVDFSTYLSRLEDIFVCIAAIFRKSICRLSQTRTDITRFDVGYITWYWRIYLFADLPIVDLLIHWGRVSYICVSKPTIICSDNGMSHGRRQAIYLNQRWNIVNWTLKNKLQWNLNRNSNIFIQENACESVVRKMPAILYRPQCVNINSIYNNIIAICCTW